MHYLSFNEAMKARFGRKMYKLSLDGGMTCPNRDGTLGTGGCIFCSGAGEFAAKGAGDINLQLEEAKKRVEKKAKDAGYIAYFQSFTNTYASPERLRELYFPVVHHPEVMVLDIATRPDCLGPEVLEVLGELAKIKPLWVELGLQTIHPETARRIHRGYELPVYDEAVRNLHAIGAEVITHQIIGLPGETEAQMLETAAYIGRSGVEGVKFHLLHIIRHTELEKAYRDGEAAVLSMEKYFEILAGCLEQIPPEMVVHRLTGDGDKRTLVAPLWSADKKNVLNSLNRYFDSVNLKQGAKWQRNCRGTNCP